MNKVLIACALILSINASAFSDSPARLIPGKQVLVDVANQEVISLLITTNHQDSGLLPVVQIEKQWSGFECRHKTTRLQKTSYNLRSWEIQIDWAPGADLSGCIVKVSFPGMEDSRAELYMNY